MNNEGERLSIALISIHGLIRGENLELGRDADTGGQTGKQSKSKGKENILIHDPKSPLGFRCKITEDLSRGIL